MKRNYNNFTIFQKFGPNFSNQFLLKLYCPRLRRAAFLLNKVTEKLEQVTETLYRNIESEKDSYHFRKALGRWRGTLVTKRRDREEVEFTGIHMKREVYILVVSMLQD